MTVSNKPHKHKDSNSKTVLWTLSRRNPRVILLPGSNVVCLDDRIPCSSGYEQGRDRSDNENPQSVSVAIDLLYVHTVN